MRVGLILDNPKRDLYGILLIAYHLTRSRNTVFIIPMYQQGYEIPLLNLDVVLMNYARPNNLQYIKTYKSLGISVVVMDTEGGILSESGSDSPMTWAKSFNQQGMANYVDKYCFWGSKVYEAFKSHSGINAENLHITGCPRFDAFNSKWHGAFKQRESEDILINTNFSSVNPFFTSSINDEFKSFLSAGWDEKYIVEVIEQFKNIFPQFIDSVKNLAIDNPDKSFIIRPHPFENPEYYFSELNHLENISVRYKDNIVDAINNAKCIIHLNCGSSVESFLGKKLPISIEYLNTEILRSHTPLPGMISYKARNYNDLNYAINNVRELSKKYITAALYDEHIEPWFYKNDGNCAQRISNVISSIEKHNNRTSKSIIKSISGSARKPRFTQIAQGILSNLLGHKLVSDFRRKTNKARNVKYCDLGRIESIFHNITYDETSNYKIGYALNPLTHMTLTSIQIKI